MKLEVGMYVRTLNGIVKIYKIQDNVMEDTKGHLHYGDFVKASYNIIDILEVGDYVNGSKVVNINYDLNYDEDIVESITIFDYSIEGNDILHNEDIKSIVTKEMFSSVEYRMETD